MIQEIYSLFIYEKKKNKEEKNSTTNKYPLFISIHKYIDLISTPITQLICFCFY